MALTNNLKQQVDLPVWEWCRFAPATTTALSSLTTGNALTNRYLYYQISAALYRYDTITDSWHQLASAPTTPTVMNNNVLSNFVGHYGQAIAGGVNTIQLAGLNGNALVGYTIRILSGTGAGQERTITAVSAATVHDRGVVTTASTTLITDASTGIGLKQWKTNTWRNYQVRIDYGAGKTQLRPILYNTSTVLGFSDVNYLTVNPWANCPLATTTSSTASVITHYVIESHQVTVNTNWTTQPDATSNFVILSGGIWNITQGTGAAPFFTFQYYDILSDVWYQKSTQTNLKTAIFTAGSDLSIERMTEAGSVIFTETAAGGGSNYITATATLTPMKYANFAIKIVGGTGIGQQKTILSNTASKINITDVWDTAPNATSVYEIWRDTDKIWLIGGGDAGMLQYSINTDQWVTGKTLVDGQCNQLAASKTGQKPFALTSITRTVTGMVATGTVSAGGTGYNVDDILTVDGKGGTLRVLTVNPTTGAVLTVSLETCGTGYTTGAKATTVTPNVGVNCQITLAGSDIDFTELAVTPINHNFKIGDSVTISGAHSTGAAKFNGTYTIIGNSINGLSFSYCSVGDPGAGTATIANSPSTTQLVDCTKNWAIDEHKGKLVQLATNALVSVGQVRRIISNTATTLVWTLAATAPVNGTTRYVIEDIKPFGTEITPGGRTGGGTEGFATGGTTTTLVDSTKNWDINYWSRTVNRLVRIVEGTGVGNEIAITSNTATTLTFATQSFSPDTTTRYVIMDTFGTATAGTTTVLTDSTKNWGVNQLSGKRIRFLSGTSQGNEYSIASNTATTITYGAGTAPDTSTAYAILESPVRTNGIHLDMILASTDTTLNNKYMYAWSGTATPELTRYNVTTEHWELLSYFPQTETLTTGSMYCYDGVDRIYFTKDATGRVMYFDISHNIVVPSSTVPYGMSTAVSGNRMEIIQTSDGLKYLYIMRHSGTEMWRTLIFW
jgi:hypothetical protein